jgi:hypothetical protein
MGCKEIRDGFSRCLDGDLPEEDKKQIQKHLNDCRSCREEYKSFQTAVSLVRGLPEVPAPPDFIYSLKQRLERAEIPWWNRAAASVNNALDLMPLRAMTAAAAGVLAVTLLFVYHGEKTAGPGLKLTGHHHDDIMTMPGMLVSATSPVPVEFASTNPSDSPEPNYMDTPTEFIMAVIAGDSEFNKFDRYPHHRGTGAIIHTPEYVLEVEMDPAEFPIIQAFGKKRMPRSLREAKMTYPIYVRALPSPTAPVSTGQ